MKKILTIICGLVVLVPFPLSSVIAQQDPGLRHADVIIPSNKIFYLSDQILKERVEMFVLQHYRENHEEVVVKCKNLPCSIPVHKDDWGVQVESHYGGITNGTNVLDVTVFSNRNIYKQLTVAAKVHTFDYIVVAKRLIDRHRKITEDDMKLVRYETTNFKRQYLTHIEDVVNLRTKQILQPGKPVFASMVELPPIIKRGDVVNVRITLKNVEVTAIGKALQDGCLGETIQVRNISSGKRITGKVLDEKTVLVRL